MAQFQFTKALLEESRNQKIHTCIETSGYAPMERYREILPKVDIFLIDYKESDPARHKKFTGVPQESIHKNIRELDSLGAKIVLRCPIIPGMNDRKEHFGEIAKFAGSLKNIIEINILPYHPLGKSKSSRLGKEYPLSSNEFPADEVVRNWLESVQASTKISVKKG